jgi:hypothetical protein
MSTRAAMFCAVICGLISGCGSSVDAPRSSPSKPVADVTITLDGVHHVCNVALSTEAQGSSIACGDVVAFLRDELRVPSGAAYDLQPNPGANEAEFKALSTSLKNAGYRFVGDR